MKIYEARYCPCIHESASLTISLHATREGAETAMNEHKERKRLEWDEMWKDDEDKDDMPFGIHEDWDVIETELLP